MADEAMTVADPFGNIIHILERTCISPEEKTSPDIYDDLAAVIKKPSIMVQIKGENEELHYFRSIGWHHTILLTVHFQNGRWETSGCIHNPPAEQLSALLKKGKQLL